MKRFAPRSIVVAASSVAAATVLLAACAGSMTSASNTGLGFFVSSTGSGRGADLGGLAGADRLCTSLATAAGAGSRTWRAYLSTVPAGGQPGVNGRDRIGPGPWRNAKGVVVAQNVTELHGANNLNKNTALTEKGDPVNGRGDTPNQHDILTGSQPDGRAFTDTADHTCSNWTSNAATGIAQLGHSDKQGGGNGSWNAAHPSRGCGQENLVSTGGAGLLYCFAVN